MMYDNFLAFMRAEVLPVMAEHPESIRLDGQQTGGNLEPAGHFRHHGEAWVVHSDTHFEPLLLALEATEEDRDPFVQADTKRGRCLTLIPELRHRQESPHKYLYIYTWAAPEPAGV